MPGSASSAERGAADDGGAGAQQFVRDADADTAAGAGDDGDLAVEHTHGDRLNQFRVNWSSSLRSRARAVDGFWKVCTLPSSRQHYVTSCNDIQVTVTEPARGRPRDPRTHRDHAATRHLLTRDGYDQVSIDAIAREAGVSRPTITGAGRPRPMSSSKQRSAIRPPVPTHCPDRGLRRRSATVRPRACWSSGANRWWRPPHSASSPSDTATPNCTCAPSNCSINKPSPHSARWCKAVSTRASCARPRGRHALRTGARHHVLRRAGAAATSPTDIAKTIEDLCSLVIQGARREENPMTDLSTAVQRIARRGARYRAETAHRGSAAGRTRPARRLPPRFQPAAGRASTPTCGAIRTSRSWSTSSART